MKHRYTMEAGRHIYRDGKPLIAILRCGDTEPWEADKMFREIGRAVFNTSYNGPIGDLPHPQIGVGHCKICGHYGDDCTGV